MLVNTYNYNNMSKKIVATKVTTFQANEHIVPEASEYAAPTRKKPTKLPSTITVSSDNKINYKSPFAGYQAAKNKECCYTCYDTIAPVAVCIDKRVESVFTNGWKMVGDDKRLNEEVTDILNEMQFTIEAKKSVRDGYITGMGMQEIVEDNSGNVFLITRPTYNIIIEKNDVGQPELIHQYIGVGKEPIDLPSSSAVIITPIPASYGNGISLILRAQPQIEQYLMVLDSNSAAIHRHGYPIFHLKLADQDGEAMPIDQIAALDGVTTDLDAHKEMSTNKQSEILTLNQTGVPQAGNYRDLAIKDLAMAMNTPNMFLGMADGVTEASAIPVLSVYYDSISSEQFQIAMDYQKQLIDPIILYKLGARPGESKLVFNNPNSANQLDKAGLIHLIATSTPTAPFSIMTQDEQRAELGLDPSNALQSLPKVIAPAGQTGQKSSIYDPSSALPVNKTKLEPEEIPPEEK